MKVFSFSTDKGLSQIGIEYQGELYNFSLAWELYKNLKSRGQGPQLNFLQVMVEADFFDLDTLQDVLFELQEVRSIEDLEIQTPVKYLPPLGRPQKILCVGRNYRRHADELGNPVPDEPIFFSKSPSAIIAHEEIIRLPANVGRVDYEGELAVIIGKRGHRVSEGRALDHIAGFTLLNDVTARKMQQADQKAGRPWFRSKSFDTFCPLGPSLVPKQAIHDFRDLEVRVRVNGETRQRGSTSEMIFDILELVSYLSKFCTLEPGDVIATGTPAGVGELNPGDEVEVEVLEIGILRNTVE
ncbi:MAG: fumarylacetoacetate hydrolase family protein [bacterium]